MLYEEWPCATIFEDDVGLATNFSERVAAVADTWLFVKKLTETTETGRKKNVF